MSADAEIPLWLEHLQEANPDALTADGFDDAYIGWIDQRWGENREPVACYSRRKCIAVLMRDGNMSEEAAEEYFEFNVIGAYMGPNTPLFLVDRLDDSPDDETEAA